MSLRSGYAAGSVATGAFGTVPGLMLLPFLTDELGIAAALAAVIVFAPKAWDVVVNPYAGRVSDRTVDPRGPRRPWLLRSGLGLAVAFALIFASPSGSAVGGGLWVAAWFLVAATAYAFFQVPYVAMPAELTDDPLERTRLMTWRVAVLALTILIAGGTAPLIRDAVGGRAGYLVMGGVMALLIALGAIGAYRGTASAPIAQVAPATGGLRAQLRIVRESAPFRALLLTFVVQALGVGCALAGVDYLASDVLERDGAATFLFVGFVAPALLLTPLWGRFGARFGKRTGYLVASLVLALGATSTVVAGHGPAWLVFVGAGVFGVGYAGCQVFPMAMLPDVAAADAATSGANRVGVFTGVWTAGETLGLALGPGLFALVLALGGYRSSSGGDVAQPDSALTAITLGFSILPAALVLLSLLALRRFPR